MPARPPVTLLAVVTLLAACGGGASAPASQHPPPPPPPPGGGQLFSADNAWNRPVDTAPLSASSGAMLAALQVAGGWGGPQTSGQGKVQVDFSIARLEASATTPAAPFAPKASGYYTPDCDPLTSFPLPDGGALEGESGYSCVGHGDCHLLVVDRAHQKLYEAWDTDVVGGTVTATCAVVWELATAYPATLRGDFCTSADAAGLPISALLFDADEVAAGVIEHAIRFILPNARMAAGVFVRPATHIGAPSGAADLPPYGTRLRLRADYPLASLPSEAARVVARALQRYGMILSDGGNIALTAADDRFTTHTWAQLGFDSHSLGSLLVSDFQVIEAGPAIDYGGGSCSR